MNLLPKTEPKKTETISSLHNPLNMGSVIDSSSVHFCVWAPNASRVDLVGDFNDWKGASHPMKRSDDGKWRLSVPEAKKDQCYQYEITFEGKTFRKNDPYAKRIEPKRKLSAIFQSNYKWKYPDFDMPSFNELVIYELHVGTFAPKNKNKPGTFADVMHRLPYLKSLGITAIEIMPPCEFPSERSWGYNVTNPFAVEESYGGAEALRKLVDEAHAHGIAIILDIVYNHFGPDDLDLWQFDGWNQDDKGGIYFYNDWRSSTPWGENRPDYGRGEVRQYIRDNALMWFEDYHVDGLRLDSTIFMRDVKGNSHSADTEIPEAWSLMQWINNEVAEHFPGKIMIAEDLACNDWVTEESGAGGAGFHGQWDASFVHPIRACVSCKDDEGRDMSAVAGALNNLYNNDPCARIVYTESHDEVANGSSRIPTEVSPEDAAGYHAQKRSILGGGLTLTARGVPMLFEGQEFLEDGWFQDDVPVDWTKAATHGGIRLFYQNMISLRLNRSNQTRGLTGSGLNVFHLNHQDKVIAFHRFHSGGRGDDVIIVANLGHQSFENYTVGSPCEGEWQVRINSDWKGYSQQFGDMQHPLQACTTSPEPRDGQPHSMTFPLAPYSMLIFSQEQLK